MWASTQGCCGKASRIKSEIRGRRMLYPVFWGIANYVVKDYLRMPSSLAWTGWHDNGLSMLKELLGGNWGCVAPNSSAQCLINIRKVDTGPRKEGFPPIPGPSNGAPSASKRIRKEAGEYHVFNWTLPRPGFCLMLCNSERASSLTPLGGICTNHTAMACQWPETTGLSASPLLFLEQRIPWRHCLSPPCGHDPHLKTSVSKPSCQRIPISNFSLLARGHTRLLAAHTQNCDPFTHP